MLATQPAPSQALETVGRARRVLIYGINYAPEPTGVGRYTGEIGAYLRRKGFEVEVVTAVPHYPGWAPAEGYRNRFCRETRDGVRITRCPLLLRSQMHGAWRVLAPLSFALASGPVAAWRILAGRPGTVLCVEPTLFAAPVALLFAKLAGARTVLHVQDLEVDAAFAVGHLRGGVVRRLANAVERVVLKGFDAVVTISGRMRDQLRAKGVAPARLSIVRNWIDLEKIRPLDGAPAYRRELGLADDAFVALYAGNVGAKQALPVVLDAAERLAGEPRLTFVIAGDGPVKRQLMARAAHLANVRFLPVQPEERLCELLSLASVHLLPQDDAAVDLVLPSKLGGMLASGRPSIVMAGAGTELSEFLGDGAVILPPGDSAALADALRRMLHDPSGTTLGSNASRIAALDAKQNLSAFAGILAG